MEEYKKGLWSEEEDRILVDYIKIHGHGHWNTLAKKSGLKRCGKSCRLRWMNYLNPGLNRDKFTDQEVDLIVRLHKLLGNRWALIAGRVPGRTDNQVKNYWNTHLSKKLGIVTKKTSKVGFISKTESSKSTESKGADKPSTQIMDSGSSCVADGDDEALDTRTNECTSNVANVAALQNIEGSCVADYKALWTNGYDELISSGLPSLLEFTGKNPVELDWNDL